MEEERRKILGGVKVGKHKEASGNMNNLFSVTPTKVGFEIKRRHWSEGCLMFCLFILWNRSSLMESLVHTLNSWKRKKQRHI